MKKLLLLLLALPTLSTAQEKLVVIPPSVMGNPFTIRIPVKFPDSMLVQYAWYRNDTLIDDTHTLLLGEKAISYTIPAENAYGSAVYYFKYMLHDDFHEWSHSPRYAVTFLTCIPPAASAITGSIEVCANTTGLTYSVTNVQGVSYAWTVTGSGWSITAGQNSNSVTVKAGTVNGTISVTPTTTATSCVGAAQTLAVTVNAPSTLTRSTSGGAASQTVCAGTAITSIVYTRGGSATNSSISWSPSTPAGISYNASSGTISGTPTTAGTFTYTITTSGHTAPCAAVTATGTITVNQASTLTRSGGDASQTICQNSAITNIVYTRNGSATGFSTISWSPSTPAGISVSGGGSGTTYTISGTPTAINAYAYTITTTGGSCPATAIGTITRGGVSTIGSASVAAYSCSGGISSAGTVSVAAHSCSGGISSVGTVSVAAYSCSGGISNVGTISVAPAN